ncbi:MAG: phosphoglycerate dehydrogenase [Pseudonocardia sp.]|nr:phosphoglycerate dehydrogenase [Pseudonocardia sp.]ODV02284.1 MAG: phosphoglycerate dehydrogenase [Pseudonocardia sp. SCN 73-27]
MSGGPARMVQIVVADDEGAAVLTEVVPGSSTVVVPLSGPLPAAALGAEVLVPPFAVRGTRFQELAARMPRLRLIQLLTVGVDQWQGAVPAGVTLSNCRGAHDAPVAEWIVASLLAVLRDLPRYVHAQAASAWAPGQAETLAGKRVLVVGAGDVATAARARLEVFGATVTLVGRAARHGVSGIDSLDDLLPHHDVCVLAIPLTDSTAGLIGASRLAALPDGAVLVNAGRGGLADTTALDAALRTGRLRAALDVTDPEPLPADHPLWSAPGLLLTPHVAGRVAGVGRRAYTVAGHRIASYFQSL